MLLYIIIGLIYWTINVFVRRIYVDGDYALPFIWVFFWPLCFIALAINRIIELKNRV